MFLTDSLIIEKDLESVFPGGGIGEGDEQLE